MNFTNKNFDGFPDVLLHRSLTGHTVNWLATANPVQVAIILLIFQRAVFQKL